MPKSNRFYQAQTHKNVTRDRFIRSVNPVVGMNPGRAETEGGRP